MYLNEDLKQKWADVLNHEDCDPIKDPIKKGVVAHILENTQVALRQEAEQQGFGFQSLTEAPANQSGAFPNNPNLQGYNPVLISLLRRSMPNLMAFDVAGVQPMSGPTGLIFALRSKYSTQGGTEALHNEADTSHSSDATPPHEGTSDDFLPLTGTATPGDIIDTFTGAAVSSYGTAQGLTTAEGEALGDGVAPEFAEMAFSIDKVTVTAKTRALKAEYTMELAQDLKAIHNLDAETELANILSSELLFEINRELIRTIYLIAVAGAQEADIASAGTFDLNADADGRWNVERWKGLMYQLERDANAIGKQTRRGRGNFIICSSNVASALSIAGLLDSAPALTDNLGHDGDNGNTFVGVLNKRFKVYVDPYQDTAGKDYYVMGYRGASQMDAGLFYCPYVPLQMVRAVGENSFQPKIGFKTRYGMRVNPFSNLTGDADGELRLRSNIYYRLVQVDNILV